MKTVAIIEEFRQNFNSFAVMKTFCYDLRLQERKILKRNEWYGKKRKLKLLLIKTLKG